MNPIEDAMLTLRPARPDEREVVHRWLAAPGIAEAMFGPPLFPETPAPSYADFCLDYADHFFDGGDPWQGQSFILERAGRPVGHLNHGELFNQPLTTELDVWLAAPELCGQGHGPAGLDLLCRRLAAEQGVRKFILRPSARNTAAIRAYQKAGFVRKDWALGCIEAAYGPCDYSDCALLVREM